MQSSESEAIILSFVSCALARFWMFLLSGLKTIAPCATYATGVWIKIFGVKYHSDLLQDCVAEACVKPSPAWSWTQGKSPAWSKDIYVDISYIYWYMLKLMPEDWACVENWKLPGDSRCLKADWELYVENWKLKAACPELDCWKPIEDCLTDLWFIYALRNNTTCLVLRF